MPHSKPQTGLTWVQITLALVLVAPTPFVAVSVSPLVFALYLVPVLNVLGCLFGFKPKSALESVLTLIRDWRKRD